VRVYGWRSLAFPVLLLTVAARDPREPTHSSVKVCGCRFVYVCVCVCVCVCMGGGAWPSLCRCSRWLLGTLGSPHTPLSRCVDLGLCMCVCLCVCKYGWSLAFPVPLLTVAARDLREPTHSSVKVRVCVGMGVCVYVCVSLYEAVRVWSLAFSAFLLQTQGAHSPVLRTLVCVRVCACVSVCVCAYVCVVWVCGDV